MNVQGILKSDDIITRFFRLSTQMMVELCYRQIPDSSTVRAKLFHTIDAYVKLIVLLVKHSGDANAITTKTNLLNKVSRFIFFYYKGKNFISIPSFFINIYRFLELLLVSYFKIMMFKPLTSISYHTIGF